MKVSYLNTALAIAAISALTGASAASASEGESHESLALGAGKAKLGALLQAWMVDDTTNAAPNLNFALRRAEIKLSGSVADDTRWWVMVDGAKAISTAAGGDPSILQDLGVAFSLIPELELAAGQFKIQTTPEGLDSSSELWFAERSMQARTFGDQRQPGAMLTFKKDILKATLMLSNGGKPNNNDSNNAKNLSLRVEAKPIDMLSVGTFLYAVDTDMSQGNAWGLNARLKPVDGLEVRGDLVLGNSAASVKSTSLTLDAGYSVTEKLQPVVRFDMMKPDTSVDFTASVLGLGLNYYVAKNNAKIQGTYYAFTNAAGGLGKYTVGVLDQKGGAFVLNLQAAL